MEGKFPCNHSFGDVIKFKYRGHGIVEGMIVGVVINGSKSDNYFADYKGLPKSEKSAEIDKVLKMVNLQDRAIIRKNISPLIETSTIPSLKAPVLYSSVTLSSENLFMIVFAISSMSASVISFTFRTKKYQGRLFFFHCLYILMNHMAVVLPGSRGLITKLNGLL